MLKKTNLSKYLGQSGILSRRGAAEAVKMGKITVNGKIVLSPAELVDDSDVVQYNGITVTPPREHRTFLLNKPTGYTTTRSDAFAEKTVFDLLPAEDNERLNYAGRLDKESEGLLILSTDGDLVNQISHPRYEVLKCYYVKTVRPLKASEISQMNRGVTDDGEQLKPKAVLPFEDGVMFILNEGKKREIRRIIANVAHCKIKILRRISTGELLLNELKAGKFYQLSDAEIQLAKKPNSIPEELRGRLSEKILEKL